MNQLIDSGKTWTLPALSGMPAAAHVFEPQDVDAIHAALACGRPLLVRGEPGTGKSQLARAAAVALERPFLRHVIDARTEARDLLYRFDAVARLAEAQVQGALGERSEDLVRDALLEERFIYPGPLWWAFDWNGATERVSDEEVPSTAGAEPANGVVLLIDEIDKADSAVPNGLLECLGEGGFSCPGGLRVERAAGPPPLVVITTNEERALPDAFLRRCLVLHLAWPEASAAFQRALVRRGQAHFPDLEKKVLEEAAEMVAEDREEVARSGLYAPGGAEYLDLLRTIDGWNGQEKASEILERIRHFALQKHAKESL